jgi:ribosomal protein S6--L-glutamate ligase
MTVRLWLLSHLHDSPGNRLILAAAERAGHDMTLIRPAELTIQISGRPEQAPVLYGVDGPCQLPDLVFTRMGSSAPADAFETLRQLAAVGVPCVNTPQSLEVSRDKARSFLVLARHGVPLPQTVLLGRQSELDQALRLLGAPPWIVKLPVSTQGMGVARVDSVESLRSVADVLHGLGQRVLVQHYVEEAEGTDIRVLVLGGHAVAAMRRRARPGEIRSNLHQGGESEEVALLPEWSRVAEAAARAMGLEVAGVDLLPSRTGPVVCEVNGSPGLQGLEQATQRDLAAEVVAHVIGCASPTPG